MIESLIAQFDTLNKLYFAECVTSLIILITPWFFKKRIGITAAFIWDLFILRQMYAVFTPFFNVSYGRELVNVMQVAEAQALIQILAYPAIIFSLPNINWKVWWTSFMLIDLILIIMGCRGIMTGVSFEPGVFAILSPWYLSLGAIGLPLIAMAITWIIWQKSLTGIIVFFLAISAYFWQKRSGLLLKVKLLTGLCFIGAAGIAALILKHKDFSSFSPRRDLWHLHMHFWWDKINHYIGMGLGSYEWTAPFLKVKNEYSYVAMHNDFLQILFETGFIGLSAFLIICGLILHKARVSPILFGTTIGAMAFMATYYPLHVGMTEVMYLFLIKEITNDQR